MPIPEWPGGLGGGKAVAGALTQEWPGALSWGRGQCLVGGKVCRILRGLVAVVGTVLVGKFAWLLLAEGEEAIGSRLRHKLYVLANSTRQNQL